MSNNYISLLGIECQTKSDKILIYPIELLELFVDPITYEIFNNPIVIEECPNSIYEKNNLLKWFYRSNREPFIGIELEKFIKFIPIINFYIALALLEKKDDFLIFHQPNIDLINLFKLFFEIVKTKNKKNMGEKQNNCENFKDLNSNENIIQLDLEYYLKHENYGDFNGNYIHYVNLPENYLNKDKSKNVQFINCIGVKNHKNYFEEHYNFTLQDILLNDFIYGKPIKKPVLVSGILMDQNSLQHKNLICQETIDQFTVDKTFLECKILFNKIVEKFIEFKIEQIFKIKDYEKCKKDYIYRFEDIFNFNPSLKLRKEDF